MKYFITGIDTDSGKTLTSAVFCEALEADYWKPIQAGLPKDSDTVRSLVSSTSIKFHPEKFLLKMPASPHAAAKAEDISIQKNDFTLPNSERLIIEGAGGCLVPINQKEFVIDLASHFNTPVILVADLYLGSINHTLLTTHFLKSRKVNVAGLVFNGDTNPESESIILHHSGYRKLLHIHKEPTLSKSIVRRYADLLKASLHE